MLSSGPKPNATPANVRNQERAGSLSSVLDDLTIYTIDSEDEPLAKPESIRPPIIAQTLSIPWIPAHEYRKLPAAEHNKKTNMGHFKLVPK